MGVWLNYYAARMRLARELGTMKLDPDGRWIAHPPVDSSLAEVSDRDASPLPPVVPTAWMELADRGPPMQQTGASAPAAVPTAGDSVGADIRPVELVEETDHVD
jgi:hypothetical protein